MANLGENFNANDAPEVSFEPIPAGVYTAMIVDSEKKLSKSGNEYLNLKVEIIEGKYKGRVIFDILNLWHSNEKTRNIARGTLGKIQKAVNVIDIQDSSMLHNKPLKVKLAVRPAQNGYDASNDIKGYKSAGIAENKEESASFPDEVGKPWEAAYDDDF